MRPIRTVLLYILAVLIVAALTSPLFYYLGHYFLSSLPFIADQPFSRYLSRIALIVAILGIIPLRKLLGIYRLKDISLGPNPRKATLFFKGIAIGLISLTTLAGLQVVLGARSFTHELLLLRIPLYIGKFIATALVVAMLEEIIFRGIIYHGIKKAWHWIFATVVSSIIFASLHFMDLKYTPREVYWYTGIEALPTIFAPLLKPSVIFPGILNLTLAGMVLCIAVEKTGSLWLPIGIHAGWVFAIKLTAWLLPVSASNFASFWGTNRIVDGYASTFVLGLLCYALYRTTGEQHRPPTTKPPK